MAETISISSPSLFLDSPGTSPTAHTSVKKGPRRPPPPQNEAPKASDSTKRKQSKSRNGCITCKAKRLKCDETKPTCQQCARRSVACGGYKKDFKWRAFEETSFSGRPTSRQKKGLSPTSAPAYSQMNNPSTTNEFYHQPAVPDPSLYHAYAPPPSPMILHPTPPPANVFEPAYPTSADMSGMSQSPYLLTSNSHLDPFSLGSAESSDSTLGTESIHEGIHTRLMKTESPSSASSGQSPRLLDLLLPGTDLSVPPEEYMSFRSQYPDSFYQPSPFTPPAEPDIDDHGVEEIPRVFDSDWVMPTFPSTPSTSSTSSSCSNRFPLLREPAFSSASPEMWTRRFDRATCGILSVKDGPTENPWRTLVWPLARDCPALYHAVASLTLFHHSVGSPTMRYQGIDHMRHSIHALASSLENLRVDAAICTTLALAFSESWDQHISTGVNHIKGARLLIHKALVQQRLHPAKGEDLDRLKFLCNTWVYMDVIARLTSADEDESCDFDTVTEAIAIAGQTDTQVDPLMGSAGTLFPIIGRVANLVRKVRRSDSNSPSIISQAIDLKKQLEDWVPPAFIEDPEDETTSPHDSMRTAAAYQYATLLYLHQAVPEIPSLPAVVLAKRALCELATVGPTSRHVIVHIYPLMAAGCEAVSEEDREWVASRWEMLRMRMKLGIIEKCQQVTKEVWDRRDAYVEESFLLDVRHDSGSGSSISSPTSPLKRTFSSISDDTDEGLFCWLDAGNKRRAVNGILGSRANDFGFFDSPPPTPVKASPTEALAPEFTVKGRLHWLGVMKDWNWEILLG